MKIGLNYYEFKNSLIFKEQVYLIPFITVAVTLGCIAYENSGSLLYLCAIILNLFHFITYTLYLKRNFKFAVTKNGLILLHGKAYIVPWNLISVSQKETTLNDVSIFLNIINLESTKEADCDTYENYLFFRSKSYILNKKYYFGWRKKLVDKKQECIIEHFLSWKQQSILSGINNNKFEITTTNLTLRIVLINLLVTALIYVGGIMLTILL